MHDEYISREAAVKDFEANNARNPYWTPPRVKTLLLRQPTADVAEVVRCKDCRWRGIEECAMFYRCECGEQHTWETDNDFCSYGERREE